MKKIISLFILLSACGGNGGSPATDYIGTFEFNENYSTCQPEAAAQVLTLYASDQVNFFEIKRSNGTTYVSGESNDDLSFSYSSSISNATVSQDAECTITLYLDDYGESDTLVEKCESSSLSCGILWDYVGY